MKVRMHVLPGGQQPRRQTAGSVGHDAHLRVLVSQWDMDEVTPQLRRTLFNFDSMPADPEMAEHVRRLPLEGGGEELVFDLQPGEVVLGGIGIITEFPMPYVLGIWPRSGLLIKNRIDVSNAPGTVDPDYRGEAGVLIENRGRNPFTLRRGMRLAQIIFLKVEIPEFEIVETMEELSTTVRNADGFGSTGI